MELGIGSQLHLEVKLGKVGYALVVPVLNQMLELGAVAGIVNIYNGWCEITLSGSSPLEDLVEQAWLIIRVDAG